jgi:hypothetical protein
MLDLREGRRAAGLAHLGRARRMNPREPAIAGAAPDQARLSQLAVPGPLGRHSVTCRPVLGLAAACTRAGEA